MLTPKRLEDISIEACDPEDPTHNRATLTIRLSLGKLFKMFPWVLSPKVKNPAKAIVKHATMDVKVERCVTRENLSMVGFFSDPYINRELWSWFYQQRSFRKILIHTAHECECDNANSLHNAVSDKKRAFEIASEVFWYPGALRYDRD